MSIINIDNLKQYTDLETTKQIKGMKNYKFIAKMKYGIKANKQKKKC